MSFLSAVVHTSRTALPKSCGNSAPMCTRSVALTVMTIKSFVCRCMKALVHIYKCSKIYREMLHAGCVKSILYMHIIIIKRGDKIEC